MGLGLGPSGLEHRGRKRASFHTVCVGPTGPSSEALGEVGIEVCAIGNHAPLQSP